MIDGERRLNGVIRKVLSKQHERNPWQKQFIYVVRCDMYVKIGIATDPHKRLSGLQTGCPYLLQLLKYWPSPDAPTEEDEIHSLLEPYRHRGEWFKLPDDILKKLLKV